MIKTDCVQKLRERLFSSLSSALWGSFWLVDVMSPLRSLTLSLDLALAARSLWPLWPLEVRRHLRQARTSSAS